MEPLRNNGTVDSAESYLGRERECAVTETGTTWTIFQRATNPPAGWAALGSGESDWRVEAAQNIRKQKEPKFSCKRQILHFVMEVTHIYFFEIL